jgi:O-phosphoseryl-tRNA(Cys) synthetase
VVGLFGAIEIQHLNGPAFVDTDYVADGRVLAISDTPKTEYFWYEAVLTDAAEGTPIASMLMMLRFMKVSSPLWQ